MRIFKIENGKAFEKEIKGDLESLQAEVGGLITTAPHFDELTKCGIDIYADDEGLLKPNPKPSLFVLGEDNSVETVLVGNLIFTGFDEEGRTKGLHDEQISFITEHLRELTYAAADGSIGKAFTFRFA